MATENFVDQLQAYHEFSEVFDQSNYTKLPDDWLIIATDIKGSTTAIEAGRYKEVNTLGATCIISCINATKEYGGIAFQFGGDGALLAAPNDCLPTLNKALCELSQIAKQQFEMDLRICIWKVSDFTKAGLDFLVLKHDLTPGQPVFMFSGSGVEASDEWLKGETKAKNLFSPPPDEKLDGDFVEGLECRWNALQNRNGQMVTGLVKVIDSNDIEEILQKLHNILDEPNSTEPIRMETLPTRWPPKDYIAEWKVKAARLSKPMAYLEFAKVMSLLLFLTPIVWIFKKKIPYIGDLVMKSDFQKFDGMYRFVRDLNSDQLSLLEKTCQEYYEQKKVFYGLHKSDTALMTCMVFTQEDHLHFVDGGDGGYAMAAKQLKEQMSQAQF